MGDVVRILIIDDSADDRELYRRALKKNLDTCYDIVEAEDGDCGLAELEQRAPDCVLLDYSLPGRNGIEVLKHIHTDRPFVPVVMLTGQGNETVAVTAMREGAQNYISKSTITPDTFHHAIQVAIEHCAMEKRIDEQRKSLEIFTRALAHDLKEPVRTIKSFLDLLAAQENLSQKGQGYFARVQKAADRMDSLIDTVYFYTRLDGLPQDVPKEACGVAAVLEEAKENLAELIRERNPTIICDPLPRVRANRMQLLQVFQNLLCNAIKHCDKRPAIRIQVSDETHFWCIRVIDNGLGIGEQEREKIFEPFTRLAREDARGLGLGLAICRKIVESHGGKIRCEAANGGGAVFIFTLPKAEPVQGANVPSQMAEEAPRDGVSARAGSAEATLANVLLVDDNEADIELTQIMLGEKAKLRCNFLVAQDAYEALDVLQKKTQERDKVDLMLLDINMPGMSGLELLGRMREEDALSGVPVVMCSTSTYDKDITRACQLGALGYIAKPAEMRKLEPLIAKTANLRLSVMDDGYLLLRGE
jgi:signal transduction histidine kinase